MKSKNVIPVFLIFCLFTFISYRALANDISVTNFSMTGQNSTSHSTMVKFDISWENSWRTSSAPFNWDAAWVFVKYRIGTGAWQHAWLNNMGHIAPSGSTIDVGLLDPSLPFNTTTNPGLGAFIFRDANGTGNFSKTGVQLRWNYGANGVADNATVQLQVFAIEMVYVPQGSFYAGSGGTESGAFYKYPLTANPYQITGEGAITVGTGANNLFYTGSGDYLGPIPAGYPKGYNPYYCMKYEMSQQEYVDFLNSLTSTQASNRYSAASIGNRYGISVSGGVYSTVNPYVACNWLNWTDVAAYLDWSGLRPMTELEFEKSCRGTLTAVPNEYAWGTTVIAVSPYSLSNSGASNESISTNYSNTAGNAAYNLTTPSGGSINGPLRVGIFATITSTRVSSGATYYGIMDMSGNLMERSVTVGNPTGRGYTGSHGNGALNATGFADAVTWPGTDALGAGVRGGRWNNTESSLRVSDRIFAAFTLNDRFNTFGGRGVRTAH